MAQLTDSDYSLSIVNKQIEDVRRLVEALNGFNEVGVIILPGRVGDEPNTPLLDFAQIIEKTSASVGPNATVIVIADTPDLVEVARTVGTALNYQLWIAVKSSTPRYIGPTSLPYGHFGILVYTKYEGSLKHAKTRIPYTYCPVCNKTTKDYGGKKHTYHEYGTLMSDVWRDIPADLAGDMTEILSRLSDLFAVRPYSSITVFDCRSVTKRFAETVDIVVDSSENALPSAFCNTVLNGDCLSELRKIPDNSVDFAFADPPYNLQKQYTTYSDDLELQSYFTWCDAWLSELARVLKPGRTLALLNIPLWTVRHYHHLQTVLRFQNWIAWDALSYPVRMIMPAHYSIVCFSKGVPRSLPAYHPVAADRGYLRPLADGYCLRARCVRERRLMHINDREELTDLWADIHRLKHNTRRVDHPTQLPPALMYRLIAAFTFAGEVVLDPFNGSGTTTLAAHQLKRRYLGIELSAEYAQLALDRHREISDGFDPFRKQERELTAKNSPVPRLPKRKYAVTKNALQLEVRRVARELGRIPTRDELVLHGRYSIQYYDEYFVSWGEVCAAARTTGMSEDREERKAEAARDQAYTRLRLPFPEDDDSV